MERIISFRPAFDKTDPDPKKNYGIHCMDMFMIVKGDKGTVEFTIYTGWYLEQNKGIGITLGGTGASICYHSATQKYEGQEGTSKCQYMPEGTICYSDCTYSQGDDLFDLFVAEGEEVVWKELEERYNNL